MITSYFGEAGKPLAGRELSISSTPEGISLGEGGAPGEL